jgi:(S)-2-hydroxy-acid oxidase
MQRLAHPDGEIATSRAAASQGVTMTLSTFSNASIEEVIEAGRSVKQVGKIPAPDYWLQLYCFQNRKTTEGIIRRAEAAGYKAVVLTVDSPYLGKRYNEIRNKFTLPPNIRLGNFGEDVKTFGETVTLEQESAQKNKLEAASAKKKIGGPIPDAQKNDNGIDLVCFEIYV